MTDKPEFKREDRYIVIKRSHLAGQQEANLTTVMHALRGLGITPIDCVVVEHDWPEYALVWQMIEARVTGADPVPPAGGDVEAHQNEVISRDTDTDNANHGCRVGCTTDADSCAIDVLKLQDVANAYIRQGDVSGALLTVADILGHVTRLQAEVERIKTASLGFIEEIRDRDIQLIEAQAEVERLKAAAKTASEVGAPYFHHLKRQNKALQSELTKARELNAASLKLIEQFMPNVGKCFGIDFALLNETMMGLSNQSAPADKGQDPNKADRLAVAALQRELNAARNDLEARATANQLLTEERNNLETELKVTKQALESLKGERSDEILAHRVESKCCDHYPHCVCREGADGL